MTAIMLFRQAPTYYCIWLLAFVCILFVAAASHKLKSPLAVIHGKRGEHPEYWDSGTSSTKPSESD